VESVNWYYQIVQTGRRNQVDYSILYADEKGFVRAERGWLMFRRSQHSIKRLTNPVAKKNAINLSGCSFVYTLVRGWFLCRLPVEVA
jgi:hypothetical protein